MSMVTLTPQPLSIDKNNHRIRDEPLSSNFLPSKIKSKDGEIGIFGAEKYFNEEKNQKLTRKSPKKPPQIERMNPQEKKTPSESSWGSQKAFLQTFPPNPHQKKPKKSFLATIGCNCYCNDEKSVETNDRPNEAIAASNSKKIGEEASQIMEEKNNKKKKNSTDIDHDHGGDKMRNSLEVFGSPKKNNSLRIEKRLAMLDVEVVEMCDDMYEEEDDEEGSDASSDLFEISSFTNSKSILLRQASDGPTTCYAPSEASVEWSIVTASAAEMLSVFSDFEEPGVSVTKAQKKVVNGRKEVERRRSLGILSGCKSQKAVRVAENAYRANGEGVHDPRRNHIARSHGPVKKF